MTLNELIRKAQALAFQLSSGDIPINLEKIPVEDLDFELMTDEDGDQYVEITGNMEQTQNNTLTPAQQAAKEYSDRMRTEMKGQSNGIALYEAFLAGWEAAMRSINTY